MDKFHDSACVPWEGREFSSNPFANDDGSTPEHLRKVIESEVIDKVALFHALEDSRLLIPLLADLGDAEIGAHGQLVDKSADLSIVAVATPDKQSALPAFSSVQEMQLWKADARPVPVEARKVAIATIAEGHTRLVLNPGSKAIALRRPFLANLAQQKSWSPPEKNPWVIHWVREVAMRQPHISAVDLFDGDVKCDLGHAELLVQLGLRPKISAENLKELLTNFTKELQSEEFLAQVDSIAYRLVTI
jgi:hypothetical protein